MFVDLHTHTTASDGGVTPQDIVLLSQEAGLSAIAITDHDTVAGVIPARLQAQALMRPEDGACERGGPPCGSPCSSFKIVAGCEIAVKALDDELHIVGLFAPLENGSFLNELAHERQQRDERNALILERLNSLGLTITEEDVLRFSQGASCGRPHIARAMVSLKLVPDVATAFSHYIGKGQKAFVGRRLRSPEEGISMLASFGCTVVWAHPCLSPQMTVRRLESLVQEMKGYGLDAIEAYHTSHSNEQVARCVDLARKYDLLVSGGSDFHGRSRKDALIGYYNKRNGRIPGELLRLMEENRLGKGLSIDCSSLGTRAD